MMPHRVLHVLVCTLACGCIGYPSYTNRCGEKPMQSLDNNAYIDVVSTGEELRPLLALLGVQLAMVASAACVVKEEYGRAAYVAFALVWVSIMLVWHSPCGQHDLGAGSYMAFASTVVATLSALVAPRPQP